MLRRRKASSRWPLAFSSMSPSPWSPPPWRWRSRSSPAGSRRREGGASQTGRASPALIDRRATCFRLRLRSADACCGALDIRGATVVGLALRLLHYQLDGEAVEHVRGDIGDVLADGRM